MKKILLITLAISALLMTLAIAPHVPDSSPNEATPLEFIEMEVYN